jgi:hypothetical protein
LQSPSAASSAEEIGRVNGCNICHQDKTLGWTAKYLNEWYDQDVPNLNEQEREISLLALQSVKGDAAQRVLAASLMGWTGQSSARGWQAPLLIKMLDDPYDAIRIVAYRSLRSLPGFEAFEFDYMKESKQRASGIARARGLLRGLRGDMLSKTMQTLYDEQGILDERRYGALLKERDRRHVSIGE